MNTPQWKKEIVPLVDLPAAQGNGRQSVKFSGIPSLSRELQGFEKGELVVITAPPGQGKTQLARSFTLDFIKQGMEVLYFSFELTYGQLLAMFRLMGMDAMEEKRLVFAPVEYAERDILFVEQLVEKKQMDVLVVDDLQSMEEKYSQERRTDNMSLVIRGLAQRLKNLAVKKNLIVITMAHQSKASLDKRGSSLSDIAYSGGIAQVADVVLGLRQRSGENKAIIEIVKSRWTGSKKKVAIRNENKTFYEDVNQDPTAIVNQFSDDSQDLV